MAWRVQTVQVWTGGKSVARMYTFSFFVFSMNPSLSLQYLYTVASTRNCLPSKNLLQRDWSLWFTGKTILNQIYGPSKKCSIKLPGYQQQVKWNMIYIDINNSIAANRWLAWAFHFILRQIYTTTTFRVRFMREKKYKRPGIILNESWQ